MPLCHALIYPVCAPEYLDRHPQLRSPAGMLDATLLDLNHYGRAQLTEQFDWNAWFALQYPVLPLSQRGCLPAVSSNDYSLLVQMALDGQGLALGWDHLVRPLVEQGRLVRPSDEQLILKDEIYYLMIKENKAQEPACRQLSEWLIESFS